MYFTLHQGLNKDQEVCSTLFFWCDMTTLGASGDTLNVFRACTDRKCKRAARVLLNRKVGTAGTSCAAGTSLRPCFEALVTSKDNEASNGVVHIIDAVLLPPGFSP